MNQVVFGTCNALYKAITNYLVIQIFITKFLV